jgi:hypothetical protein
MEEIKKKLSNVNRKQRQDVTYLSLDVRLASAKWHVFVGIDAEPSRITSGLVFLV